MKKVLALLLACMLPICALAETYGLTLTVDTDETLFADALRAALAELPEAAQAPQMDAYVSLIQQLLDGLTLDAVLQEDAVSLAVSLEGGNLLDCTFHDQGDRMLMTSSLMAGVALAAEYEAFSPEEEAAQAVLNDLDWTHLWGLVTACINTWQNGLEPIVTHGQFVGDAYTGGTKCTTWAVTDQDIAALVTQLCSGEVREAVSAALTASGFDAQQTLAALDDASARVEANNAYQYLLRVVNNDADEMVGCSLSVFSGMAQLATASLGIQEGEGRLVIGFAVQDQNYWCELAVSADEGEGQTLLKGHCIEWLADQQQSFAFVKVAANPVSHQAWQCSISHDDQQYRWDACFYDGGDPEKVYLSSQGAYAVDADTLDCSISLGKSGNAPLTLLLLAGPTEAIAEPEATLARYSLNDPADEAQIQELAEQVSATLMARLIKLMPLELVLQLSMPQMP